MPSCIFYVLLSIVELLFLLSFFFFCFIIIPPSRENLCNQSNERTVISSGNNGKTITCTDCTETFVYEKQGTLCYIICQLLPVKVSNYRNILGLWDVELNYGQHLKGCIILLMLVVEQPLSLLWKAKRTHQLGKNIVISGTSSSLEGKNNKEPQEMTLFSSTS